jgi:hypothetical protein
MEQHEAGAQESRDPMGRNETAKIWIEGTVAPGFESVRELYEHNMQTFEERNTQLCIYYKGERVVDLWASAVGGRRSATSSSRLIPSSTSSAVGKASSRSRWLPSSGRDISTSV